MEENQVFNFIEAVIDNMPKDWLTLTTHRLDIYNEALAKTQFTEQFENLYQTNNSSHTALGALPTAYDYIRLGHPLSSVLEWMVAKTNGLRPEHVISFSSESMPILAVLRKNQLDNIDTSIFYSNELPACLNTDTLKEVYGYQYTLTKINNIEEITPFEGSNIYLTTEQEVNHVILQANVDFQIHAVAPLGSLIIVNGDKNVNYISDIQHVRRRESIAMTPINCLAALKQIVHGSDIKTTAANSRMNTSIVHDQIRHITNTNAKPLLGSSGLSIQYAIVMGLIHQATIDHKGKDIKIIVPPNCYGGTNDQARRVAASIQQAEIKDLPVDGDNDMVKSIDQVLAEVAHEDAIPFIIAEIPTNPRVEVPDLIKLEEALSKVRQTAAGEEAVKPVFILDQTFCPNVQLIGEGEILSNIRTVLYVSGSKFPSGGKCTAGYCVANKKAENLLDKIEEHIVLCDNQATDHQVEILAEQLPSMIQRIGGAYKNTREFVRFIKDVLPAAKINFVSEELASQGFTPSVFSLDLPTKGDTPEEREFYKRALNHKLIDLMITEIPNECKYCVSYGQLKGSYWTIPATSTQGTTKEGDKDYIVRVSMSGNLDMDHHKMVFAEFVKNIE